MLFVAIALVAGACRGSAGSSSTATPLQVYTAGPTETQVRTLLGSDLWWPGAPSFGVRPLNLSQTPETVRFSVTQHYIHLGTPETLNVQYISFTTTANATTAITNVVTALGTNAITSPKVGDQVLYSGQKQQTSSALYSTETIVRLGALLLVIDLTQVAGFPDINQLARIAGALLNRVKDVLAKKVDASPVSTEELALLPPAGTDITMVGAAKLPIEATAQMFNAADPQSFVKSFTDLGVSQFDYGDYALDADLHMEVQAAEFSFATPEDATTWIDEVVGKSNLDSSGVAAGYSDTIGKYYGVFSATTHVGFLLCKSTDDTEAAARACEVPLARVLNAWQASLSH